MGGVAHISYKVRGVSHFSNVRFSICSLKIVSLLSLPLLFGLVNSNITLDKRQLLDTTYLFLYNSHLTHDSNYMGCTKIDVTSPISSMQNDAYLNSFLDFNKSNILYKREHQNKKPRKTHILILTASLKK